MDRAICLGDVNTEEMRRLLGNRCFTKAILAIAGTTTKVKTTTNTVQYSIDGQLYEKAATDNLFVHTDLAVQSADTTKYYLLSLDKDGNALITQGNEVLTAKVGATDGTQQPFLPKIASTQCVIGAIKVVTVGVTFAPGTDAHNKSGVTTTYYNLSCVPTSGLPA